MNKIQEECNRSDGNEEEEEEGEVEDDGDLSDDPSTLPEDDQEHSENMKNLVKQPYSQRFILEVRDTDETGSTKSCDMTKKAAKKPLHRAHSCGSLLGLKAAAGLTHMPMVDIWDLLRSDYLKTKQLEEGSETAAPVNTKMGLQLASAPLALLHLQNTSRCCNLC